MFRSRLFEESLEHLASEGLIWGTYHLSIGQEACHIGLTSALRENDWLVPTHRCHGYNIGQGTSLYAMFSEMLGSRHGICKGIGGSMHMTDAAHGNFGSSAVVGSGVSLAGGLALSLQRSGAGGIAVAVFGDGAASRGTVHEMMNIASVWNLPLLFFLENNHYGMSASASRMISTRDIYRRAEGYSIRSVRIDGNDVREVHDTAEEARRYILDEHRPFFIEADTYRMCGHSRSDRNAYRSREEEEEWRKKDPIARYEDVLLSSSAMSREEIAAVRHSEEKLVRTAMDRAIGTMADHLSMPELHDLAAVRMPSESAESASFHEGTYRDALYEALDEILSEDPRSFLMGEDIAAYGGCFGVSRDLYLKHPGQVLETPVSEETFTGMAAGAAALGEHPVVELMYGDFSTLSSDALINHAAKLRFMSAGQLSCPMVIRLPMGGGTGHGAQHTQSLETMFTNVPGLIIAAPSDARSAKGLLKSAVLSPDPVLFIEHKALYGEPGMIGGADDRIPLGKALVHGTGSRLLVIGYSHAFALARKTLEAYEDDITFIDLATIHPLDEETLRREYMRVPHALIVQDTPAEGSVGESVFRIIASSGADVDVRILSAESMPVPVSRDLEESVLINGSKILEAALSFGL